jgi:cytochrome c oxidase subunit 4
MSHAKITPTTYGVVFVALIALTGTTVGLAFVDLGAWHGVVGLTIASVKAVLIVLFFMHVLHSSRLTWIVALGGLVWLALLIGLTLADYETRQWLP